MSRHRHTAAWILALAAAGASALLAVAQGRVHGSITDETGKPVPGVKITVTLPDVGSFKVEEKSDSKGNYAVTLVDATRVYTYRFEKEGYQTLEQSFKVPISSNEKRDIQMLTLEAARLGVAAGRELSNADKAVLVFNEGAEAAQQGDEATAKTKFEAAIALDPDLGAAWTALATLSFTGKDYARAVEHAEKAHALDAQDAKALRILAEGYQQLGQTDKARAVAVELAAVDPKAGAMDLYNQGVREYNAGNMGEALALFERAVAGDSGFAKTHFMLGMCYVSQGDSAKAKQHLETFVGMAPSDPDAATAKEMLAYLK